MPFQKREPLCYDGGNRMISFLEGTVEHRSERAILVNAGGIGYSVTVLPKVMNSIAKNDSKVNPTIKLFVHSQLNLREGTFVLYGFDQKHDLDLFYLLLSVPGIGPKNAMGILATIEPRHLKAAVLNEDKDYLRRVSGLGPKTAQRLVTELASKIEYLDIGSSGKVDLDQESQAMEALVALGYNQSQAKDALKQVKGTTLQERVREALKLLGK